MRALPCCHRVREMSFDFDEDDPRMRKYSGLERCTMNKAYSCDDELSRSSSSCKGEDSFASSSSPGEDNDEECAALLSGDWAVVKSPFPFYRGRREQEEDQKKKTLITTPPMYSMDIGDVESMKEKFAKLLLGGDGSGGGRRGVSTALALSNAITDLSAVTFGELWKLEPLSPEKKNIWKREMDWLLSPTNYMVELVPAVQTSSNGCTLEIMTPRSRSDVHTSLPALQKLDSILIEVLDSMVDTEFWYAEGSSRARKGRKWWLPSPRVPDPGLSLSQRKKLGFQGKCVFQVMKAVKAINEQILLQIPLPDSVKSALPKAGKIALGEQLNRLISSNLLSAEEIFRSLNLNSENETLDLVNRLEGVCFAGRENLSSPSKKLRSPKISAYLKRAEALLRLLLDRFPNLPQTFITAEKIRSNKDVGHSIVEAYSRVLGNVAFSILERIGDVLQEDDMLCSSIVRFEVDASPGYIKRALIEQMNGVDGRKISSSVSLLHPCAY